MEHIEGKYFIKNNKIIAATDFDPYFMQAGQSVYEVIRIIDTVPLFIGEHLERLKKSVSIINQSLFISKDEIMKRIQLLTKQCAIENGNVKLALHYNVPNSETDFYAFFIAHYYPSESEYRTGVDTITVNAIRSNPNAKVANLELNARINQEITRLNVFEAILLDDNGYITEGSRSNIFMIKDDTIFTAPLHNVLPGITRSKILTICQQQNYPVEEKNLRMADLVNMEAVFLTGTSPNVLPIKQVDSMCFSSAANPLLIKIMKQYDAIITDYVENNYNSDKYLFDSQS